MNQNDRIRAYTSVSQHKLARTVASMPGLVNVMDRIDFYNRENQDLLNNCLLQVWKLMQ